MINACKVLRAVQLAVVVTVEPLSPQFLSKKVEEREDECVSYYYYYEPFVSFSCRSSIVWIDRSTH